MIAVNGSISNQEFIVLELVIIGEKDKGGGKSAVSTRS